MECLLRGDDDPLPVTIPRLGEPRRWGDVTQGEGKFCVAVYEAGAAQLDCWTHQTGKAGIPDARPRLIRYGQLLPFKRGKTRPCRYNSGGAGRGWRHGLGACARAKDQGRQDRHKGAQLHCRHASTKP